MKATKETKLASIQNRTTVLLAIPLFLFGSISAFGQNRVRSTDTRLDRSRASTALTPNRARIDVRRPVPKTTLQTRLNLGDHASPWKQSVTINGTETVQFLWSTNVTGSTGGNWEVLSKTGHTLAKGSTQPAPAPGKSSLFTISFRAIAASQSYTVRITPRLATSRRGSLPTASVIVLRGGVNKPTVFLPGGLQGTLAEEAEKIRKKFNVPALGGAIVTDKGIVSITAVGKRKHGDRMPVSHTDKWHLGSDTKAMTATLVSVLIAKKAVPGNRLSWGSTVAEVFPEFRTQMHSDFKHVNLESLLAHRSGLTNPNSDENAALSNSSHGVVVRRREFTRLITGRDHSGTIGETYSYQNGNYIIAGAMLERLTGKSWETLMRQYLFQPLGMHSAGFGCPAGTGRPMQPWGHTDGSGQRNPTRADNTPALGPAGTVHATLGDWAKYLKFQFTGSEGNLHIGLARIRAIQRAYPSDDMTQYGFGWGVGTGDRLGMRLSHDGSNTYWYCHTQVFPEQKIAFLTVSNIGGDIRDDNGNKTRDNGNGDQACWALREHLRQRIGR